MMKRSISSLFHSSRFLYSLSVQLTPFSSNLQQRLTAQTWSDTSFEDHSIFRFISYFYFQNEDLKWNNFGMRLKDERFTNFVKTLHETKNPWYLTREPICKETKRHTQTITRTQTTDQSPREKKKRKERPIKKRAIQIERSIRNIPFEIQQT